MINIIPLYQITRVVNALLAASVITFGLLMLMNYLIDHDLGEPEALPPPVTVDFIYEPVKTTDFIEEMTENEGPKEPPVINLPRSSIELVETTELINTGIERANTGVTLGSLDLGGGPIKLVAVAPVYPSSALRRNLEGYVDVQFDIDRAGTTSNIRILQSTSSLFHNAVIRAVSRWKYRPKMQDGNAMPVVNVVERVSFKIE